MSIKTLHPSLHRNNFASASHSNKTTAKMGRQSSSLVSHLKRAVKKINLILLGFKLNRRKLASILACTNRASARQCLSFNERLGLHGCIEDDKVDENRCLRRVLSTRTHDRASDDDDDVDHRADVFIANFRRQLRFERQVSLELRYCRKDSF
ncbi:hypothetical protein Pyn_35452 [Prunus yedoensis var. nudiflora]|uniref:Uncharacterized protein n=1 Tax=Prunus yedoensis var. nudiflora TaxID=2094558 RepID=A0A314ULE4_PRUYE|nr:hypothetical protein Pyn_35452 [Prunus yedoensis var. nudiflora]